MKILLIIPVLCIFIATAKDGGLIPKKEKSRDSITSVVLSITAKGENSSYPTLDPTWSYCYEFTWFGPDYDNVTRYNSTCSDYLDETRADGIPCASPIVISYDGTPPDMNYLWENHKSSVLCKRSRNQVCVKYTYYFNNQVNNVTHMCAKVLSLNSNTAMTDGCYKQSVGGYETEVCICKSRRGLYKPCNSTITHNLSFVLIFFCSLLYILKTIL